MTNKRSEFDNLAQARKQTPNDYQIKTETINLYKQLKVLALEGKAMAAYKLAKIYPQNSNHFVKWMRIAAEQGLTNAMLDMAKALAEKGSVGQLQQAANYLVRILRSDDSYIKTQAKEFLSENRLLSAEVSRQMTNKSTGVASSGFFARNTQAIEPNDFLLNDALQMK
ncbi:hypothetical protein [Legionella cardiaca]|uniref:Dot/Icm secretion system substrate n=1 Tax=Legionella cardiaca TaxID=1071983 RepID=A0ABY8AU12_9GAMM|nr:hypothetical protein [Legionella cardiaca]WED43261.1 hypothetical protein PXX05_00350 [Legionella cardiaca]